MHVKKVGSDDVESPYCCITAESPFAEGLPESRAWFKAGLGEHVEGYHLYDGDKVVGHIYYAVSPKALLPYEIESGVACIYCTYVLRGYLHKGYGRMMFDYMKNDLKSQSVKGILIPATEFREWMHYELFFKQGFQPIKEHSPYKVMYFPLAEKDIALEILDLNYSPSKNKVEVTLFKSSFCPVSPFMYNRIKKVAQSFGDKVKLVEMDGTLENMKRYGTLEPLINGKIKLYGPASEEGIMTAIEEEIFELSRQN
ncbi:MAG: GNAT family N-acetyltransferase [Candidatus Bathyarchaeota archaeon]|nr:MAG: GNAT family N-acetyltransferase [Candidatus Bathyarchaeota archaeon]